MRTSMVGLDRKMNLPEKCSDFLTPNPEADTWISLFDRIQLCEVLTREEKELQLKRW